MKRLVLLSIAILVLYANTAGAWTLGNLRVNNETQLLGATIVRGYFNQKYNGTTNDALYVDYTGSGNYIFNFLADTVSVMYLTKAGALTLAGEIVHTNEDFIDVNDFNPEGDGTNNDTVEHTRADATNRRLFNRTTGVQDTQDMDWYGEKAVSQTPTSLTLWTRASDFANCVVAIIISDQDGNNDATGSVTITPTGNDTWEEFTYTFTSTYTNDEELWIKLSITSLDTADTVDFSRCKLIY